MNTMNNRGIDRRSVLKAALAGGALLGGGSTLLAACGSGGGSADQGKSLVSQTFTTSAGFIPSFVDTYVAAQQGFWRDFGLDITVRGGQGTATSLQSIIAGSAQYGRGSGNGIQAIANDDVPIKFFLQAYREPAFTIASLPDKRINNPSDLEGKTVGIVSAGGETQLLLEIMLADANVPLSSIKTPVVGTGGAGYALAESGKLDAWVGLDQDLANLKLQGNETYSFNFGEYVKVPQQAYYTTEDVLEKQRDQVVSFAAGLLKAYDFARDEKNFDAVFDDTTQYDSSLKKDVLKASLDVTKNKWYKDGDDMLGVIDPDIWLGAMDQMLKVNAIDKLVPADRVFDTSILDDAKKLL